jgi:hypothetical protein
MQFCKVITLATSYQRQLITCPDESGLATFLSIDVITCLSRCRSFCPVLIPYKGPLLFTMLGMHPVVHASIKYQDTYVRNKYEY